MQKILEKNLAVFFVLGYLFIPLTLNGKDWQFQLTNFLFSKPISFIQNSFYPKALKQIDFSSDTIAINLLLLLLFFISIIVVIILKFTRFKINKFIILSRLITCYYIAFILLEYGFNKVFKAQFYLPEPNILYTPFGNLTKDILYWSTIGTSRFYSISMGIIEVVVAILILIKPTRILGLLTAIAIFITIVIINFGFDISVKTFSIFLLLATVFAVFPYFKTLLNFLVLQKKEQLIIKNQSIVSNTFIKNWIKFLMVGLIFIQVLYPYFKSQNFNDDNLERPFLHGAYQVTQIIKEKDTLKQCNFPIKNIFIHRKNYIIFHGNNNEMIDYHFEVDALNNKLLLQDYKKNKISVSYEFSKKDSAFTLQFKNYYIFTKAINWKDMPALQNKKHYTIDGMQ